MMTNFKRIWYEDESIRHATIKWSFPVDPTKLEPSETAYFYKFLGRHNNTYKLFYIGKTFKYFVSKRINDADHLAKQEEWKMDHPKHRLLVSVGEIVDCSFNLNWSKTCQKSIDDIESLLIYSHFDPIVYKNKSKIWSTSIKREYLISNKGFTEEGMLKQIGYGFFYK
jgi:hypothetical protein